MPNDPAPDVVPDPARRQRFGRAVAAAAVLIALVLAMTAGLTVTGSETASARTGPDTIGPGPSSNIAGVRCVQAALGLAVDGRYGQATYTAVKRFQKARGLSVDGAVGPETGTRLLARMPGECATAVPTLRGAVARPAVPPGRTERGQAGQRPRAGTFGPVTVNCGTLTCSAYLSRSATRNLAEVIAPFGTPSMPPAAPSAGRLCLKVAGPFAGVPVAGPVVFGSCLAQAAWISQEISRAANDHGPRGACLKATFTKLGITPGPPAITYWSTNNGDFCKG